MSYEIRRTNPIQSPPESFKTGKCIVFRLEIFDLSGKRVHRAFAVFSQNVTVHLFAS